MLARLRSFLAALTRRDRFEDTLDEEVRVNGGLWFYVRSSAGSDAVVRSVPAVVAAVDPNLPAAFAMPLSRAVEMNTTDDQLVLLVPCPGRSFRSGGSMWPRFQTTRRSSKNEEAADTRQWTLVRQRCSSSRPQGAILEGA